MATNFCLPIKTLIYGYAAVPTGKKAVLKRVRVHFHANSGLIVANNASINVNGAHQPLID
jgi:hypothetical protein